MRVARFTPNRNEIKHLEIVLSLTYANTNVRSPNFVVSKIQNSGHYGVYILLWASPQSYGTMGHYLIRNFIRLLWWFFWSYVWGSQFHTWNIIVIVYLIIFIFTLIIHLRESLKRVFRVFHRISSCTVWSVVKLMSSRVKKKRQTFIYILMN